MRRPGRAAGARARARPSNPTTPTLPGRYYWTEWKAEVEVIKRGRTLYVTPPGGVELKITPSIAGQFKAIQNV